MAGDRLRGEMQKGSRPDPARQDGAHRNERSMQEGRAAGRQDAAHRNERSNRPEDGFKAHQRQHHQQRGENQNALRERLTLAHRIAV
jgi:hypothetical protein